jgi:hypothetical protein
VGGPSLEHVSTIANLNVGTAHRSNPVRSANTHVPPGNLTHQRAVNDFWLSLQTKEREAVVIPLPVSMHTGQIILLTKLLANVDLVFYDFSTGKPVHTWQAAKR